MLGPDPSPGQFPASPRRSHRTYETHGSQRSHGSAWANRPLSSSRTPPARAAAWPHFRALWPKARLSQYQLGNGYGVDESIATEVPIGPGESSYHGQRTWHGPVSWDEYHCGLTALPGLWDEFEDGQVVPIGHNSAVYTTGIAGTGSNTSEFPVTSFGLAHGQSYTFSPEPYITAGLPLFVEFTTGANEGLRVEVADWCGDTWVGVEDLFCFLLDWFNQEPAAYEFGGTPGVPAIFAYLLHWFSYGVGPCEP